MGLPKGLSIINHKGDTIATLYDTNICSVDNATSRIELNSGGWYTRHTKKCMNLFLATYDYEVQQVKGSWYVKDKLGYMTPYQDGMKLAII